MIQVLAEVQAELERAVAKHGPMRGPHEGWAVIYEELDELWDEVKASKPRQGSVSDAGRGHPGRGHGDAIRR